MSEIKRIQVVVCDSGDWAGLYVDGRLAREDNAVRDEWLFDVLTLGFAGSLYRGEVRAEGYLYDIGRLPDRVEEIPADAWTRSLSLWEDDKAEARRRLGLGPA